MIIKPSPDDGRKFSISHVIAHCACGLPCAPGATNCDSCDGKNSVHIEGEIYKKQKKAGNIKKYWFVLLGKELYSYKQKGDLKHKEMKSLAGVYIKYEIDEVIENGVKLFPFMLIFPNKRRIYYFDSQEEKEKWVSSIKKAIGYSNLYDFYELKESLGKGKYGLVKQAVHKRTGRECAVKIIKKKELSLKDFELLKREIEVLKVC